MIYRRQPPLAEVDRPWARPYSIIEAREAPWEGNFDFDLTDGGPSARTKGKEIPFSAAVMAQGRCHSYVAATTEAYLLEKRRAVVVHRLLSSSSAAAMPASSLCSG